MVTLVFGLPVAAAHLLDLQFGGFEIALGSLLGLSPGLGVLWVVMPLTGRGRQRAFLIFVPIWGLGVAAEARASLANLSLSRSTPNANSSVQTAAHIGQ